MPITTSTINMPDVIGRLQRVRYVPVYDVIKEKEKNNLQVRDCYVIEVFLENSNTCHIISNVKF